MGSAQNRSRRLLPFAIAMALGTGSVEAANIIVTTGGDAPSGSSCTLRQAIASANADSAGNSSCVAGSGDDTITFAANLQNSTITLAGGELDIFSNLTITGTGQTISGGGVSRVLAITPTYNVGLSNLKISGGAAEYGAGILIAGEATRAGLKGPHKHIKDVIRTAQADGGVYMSLVTVSGNTAVDGSAGILVNGGYLAIDQSTISGNSVTAATSYAAGGLYETNSTTVITNSTISGNSVTGSGNYLTGGAYAYNSYFVAGNVTLSGNSASGSKYIAGGFSGSQGGTGKYDVFFDSTISANHATGTGPDVAGGALIGAYNYGAIGFSNTIVSNNIGAMPNLDAVGSATVQASSSLFGSELQEMYAGNGNVFSSNPRLGALANNGGPTKTMALLPGSPAIDAGDRSQVPPPFTTDQRGAGFDRIIGPAVDIGAFELQVAAPSGAVPVPTLSTWASALFAGLIALFGIVVRRRFER